MDRGYESYNLMAHCQEKNWFYVIRIRDGNYSLKSSFLLPDTPCFDETFHLKLCRKQTKEMKQNYQNFPNQYHYLTHHCSFDFLPNSCQKADPVHSYELHFRILRLEIKPGFYETLVTNTDYEPEQLKNLYASRWGIETSFRDLKYSIGLTHFHAKKKEGILQEIFAKVTNYNFCRWLLSSVMIPSTHGKNNYKICFSDAAYGCLQFFRGVLTSFSLEAFVRKHLSIIRGNRSFERRLRAQSSVSFTYRVP